MSGSPIVTEIGTAIGVVCTAAAPWEGGPNPRLTHNLPGWLLHDTLQSGSETFPLRFSQPTA